MQVIALAFWLYLTWADLFRLGIWRVGEGSDTVLGRRLCLFRNLVAVEHARFLLLCVSSLNGRAVN